MADQIKRRHLELFSVFLLLVLVRSIGSCRPGGGLMRDFKNRYDILEKHPINVSESSIAASGPGKVLRKDDPRLKPILSTSIVFVDDKFESKHRLAIETCRNALLKLADRVQEGYNEFQRSYKLKVIRGYDESDISSKKLNSLHCQGRAFDLQLTPYNKDEAVTISEDTKVEHLRRLAGLAYYDAGFSFVHVHYKKGTKFLHVSCREKARRKKYEGRCFPANAFVRLESGENKLIRDVTRGDRVLTMSAEGKVMYSDVTMIMHRQQNIEYDQYVAITTDDGRRIELSPRHLIFTNENGAIFSKDAKVNETIFSYHEDDNQFHKSRVIEVKYNVVNTGAYAPLTMDGTVVVNDIYASCYALFPSHGVSHTIFTLWRFMYKYISVDLHAWLEDGLQEYHWYPNLFRNFVNSLYIFNYKF